MVASAARQPLIGLECITPMNWIVVLLAIYVVAGFVRPGRMGSTHVAVLLGSAAVLGYVYLHLGS
jgi:hypothetical protein